MVSLPHSYGRALALLLLASLLLFLPGFFTLPPMDRDEPRFAQASKQMLESGDFVAIRFQGEARNKKPVGIYWLQAGAVALAEAAGFSGARTAIWLYRIPSLIGAVLSVLLAYWAALPLLRRQGAFLAALLFASTLLLTVEARLAKTDAVMTAAIVLAMGALARLWMARAGPAPGFATAALFWTAMAASILVKGPIGPMIAAFAALALSWRAGSPRWLGPLRPLAGLAWCALLVAPWLVLIGLKTQGAFFAESIGGDMLGKVAGGQELHGAPPLAYLAAFWVTAWPMAPFAALAAPFAWRNRRDPRVAFALAWLVPAWLVFELTPTKLPHYVLPLYPAIAILAALAHQEGALHLGGRWRRGVAFLAPLVSVLIVLAAVVLSFAFGGPLGAPFLLLAPLALAASGAMFWLVLRRRTAAALLFAPVLAFAAIAFAFGAVMTAGPFQPFALSPRLEAQRRIAASANPGCRDWLTATAGYREPSLVFLTGTSLFMTDGPGAAQFLAVGPCRIAFVEARHREAFEAALPPGVVLAEYPHVAGVNLNGGRRLDIGVYVRQGEGHE